MAMKILYSDIYNASVHRSLPKYWMNIRPAVVDRHPASGFTLLELLISMAIGLILLAAVYNLFTLQNQQLSNQDVIAEMQQNARMAMDIVSREVRMAGYNPTGTLTRCVGSVSASSTPCVGIIFASSSSISFTSDLNGNGDLTSGTANPNENIVFDRYSSSGIYAMGRTTNGTKSPVVEYLNALSFIYLDSSGTVTTNLANIRDIEITIQTIASKQDPTYPSNGGYRTYTLKSKVGTRNLAY